MSRRHHRHPLRTKGGVLYRRHPRAQRRHTTAHLCAHPHRTTTAHPHPKHTKPPRHSTAHLCAHPVRNTARTAWGLIGPPLCGSAINRDNEGTPEECRRSAGYQHHQPKRAQTDRNVRSGFPPTGGAGPLSPWGPDGGSRSWSGVRVFWLSVGSLGVVSPVTPSPLWWPSVCCHTSA